ncbi:MAG TPA: hypothetical protein VNB86_01355 [Gaiellaceae bacterium]|jgi:hypothetical protein|nr:hypothetical protein [Gaiellaceae bacterium]
MKRGLVLVAAIVASGAVAATAFSASGSVTSQKSASSVTNYLSIAYNVQYCSGANRFKITNVEYRWYRSTTTRRVPSARFNFGELGVGCTSGSGSHSHGTDTLHPCFGCGSSTSPNWTPSYLFWPYNWPYAGPPGYVGAWVDFPVTVTSTGQQVASVCNQYYLVGDGPC